MSAGVALAGNPNSGKTTLFNLLTGSSRHVGNWPGKTVEKRAGTFHGPAGSFDVVDLPGTYSLAASSPEESVTRDFLIDGEADVVVIVVDASNLERNLYLAVQVLELGIPSILVLNMWDVVVSQGIHIDRESLGRVLGVDVFPCVARRGEGVPALVEAVSAMVGGRHDDRVPA
jgi:ferrous iron transport protein B